MMETEHTLVQSTDPEVVDNSRSATSLMAFLTERAKRWAWFLTPLRLLISLGLFSLGLWVHMAYDTHVTMQNTRTMDTRLMQATQDISALNMRLSTSEAQQSQMAIQFNERITAARAALEATQQELAEAQAAAARLTAERGEKLAALERQLAHVREQQAVAIDRLRWESQTDLRALSSQIDAARAEAREAHQMLNHLRQESTAVQAALLNHSSQIARAQELLAALHEENRRETIAFTLTRQARPQQVAGLKLELTKTHPKTQQYTLRLTVGDIRIKKEKGTAHEPLFVVSPESRRLYQLVVTRVEKHRVMGYLQL
jgi:chromosome segregation ATPase